MAKTPTTTAAAVWASTLAYRSEVLDILNPAPLRDREEQLAAIDDHLLDLDAPDLAGVLLKLQILWAGQLHGQDPEARRKMRVLEDLVRIFSPRPLADTPERELALAGELELLGQRRTLAFRYRYVGDEETGTVSRIEVQDRDGEWTEELFGLFDQPMLNAIDQQVAGR